MKTTKLRPAGRIVYIPLRLLRSFPLRPRVYYNAEAEAELTNSIAELGIVEPLTVCYGDGDRYYIISGERRFRAAKALGLEEAPCVLAELDDLDAVLFRISDGFQHEELNYFEKAEYIERVSLSFSIEYSELAEKTGVPLQELRSFSRLLNIPPPMRRRMIENGLTERFARLLLHHADDQEKKALLDEIIGDRLTLSQAKARSEEILQGKKPKRRILTFFRDLTVFLNTIEHAVDTMRESGIAANSEKRETDELIEYRITIPK